MVLIYKLSRIQMAMLAVSLLFLLLCIIQLVRYLRAEWKYAAKQKLKDAVFLFLFSLLLVAAVFFTRPQTVTSLQEIPAYTGEASVVINDDMPFFSEEEKDAEVYETYGSFDWLGRCTPAMAMLGPELLPEGERDPIMETKPTGWHSVRYEDLIEDDWLYHRCHLIAYELSGENDNANNLITGTQYMNIEGMRPIENQVSAYIHRTGNHVLYRATPVFEGSDLVAKGVLIEAVSIEDDGIMMNRYCFNVQPGIIIDYSSGDSKRE